MKKKILIYILIVILALICIYLGYARGKEAWPFSGKKYQVVQLSNGSIYYGHLSLFPSPKLTNVYFAQQTQAEGGEENLGLQLVPLNSLFFNPENTMHLQKEQILWWADLAEDSQILKIIEEGK